MAEVDMIPKSYRDVVQLQRTLRQFGMALLVLLTAGLLALAGLRWRIAVDTPRLALLRTATDEAETARKQLDALRARKASLNQSLGVLIALRGGGEVGRAAAAIEQAMGAGVWFNDLHFLHEEQAVAAVGAAAAGAPSAAASTASGFTVVLPAEIGGKPSTTELQTWRLSKAISVSGNAVDHAALTEFLRKLAEQPAIADVRFLNSKLRAAEGRPTIEFNLLATLRPAGNHRGATQ